MSKKLEIALADYVAAGEAVGELQDAIVNLISQKTVAYVLTEALIDSAKDVEQRWAELQSMGFEGTDLDALKAVVLKEEAKESKV